MELAYIDLSKGIGQSAAAPSALPAHGIQPGGVVPLHSRADRPALIMVNQGPDLRVQQQMHSADPAQGGEIARESNGLQHWWKNEGNVVVVLTIADIVNDKKPDTMMPMM
jgi:hypothetical protein